MIGLFEVGLINAAVVTVLALAVWLVTRAWRQPVLVHALWLLVLVKLVTPPMIHIPWRIAATTTETAESAPELSFGKPSPLGRGQGEGAFLDAVPSASPSSLKGGHVAADYSPWRGAGASVLGNSLSPGGKGSVSTIPWLAIVMATWLGGTAIFLTVTIVRLWRFHRALAHASPAPDELNQLAEQVARQMKLHRPYRLRVTEGRLSPLVWPIGRPTVLLSRPLIAQLSTDEIQTLLAHEFAHLCRRDHWVRWLEVVAVSLYWWHPVAWWARAMIHRTEERACDAWVVWAFPDAARRYATALLAAVEFVSEERPPAPLLASRLEVGGNLKERIEYVMSGTCTRRLSLVHKLSLLVVAAVVLPLSLQTVRAADEKPAADPGLAAPPTASSPGAAQPGAVPAAVWFEGEPEARFVDANLAATVSQPSKIEKEIELKLQTPVKLDFTDMPFEEAMQQLGEAVGIDIHIEQAGLEAEGLTSDEPVTIRLKNQVSLRSALNLILKPFHLTFVIEDEVLKITSKDMANPLANRAQAALRESEPIPGDAPGSRYAAAPGAPIGAAAAAPGSEQLSANPFAAQPAAVARTAALPFQDAEASSESQLSTSVWKKIVDSKKKALERMELLAKKQAVSSAEVEKAKIDYEISVARQEQATRVVKYNELLVKLAAAELQEAVDKQAKVKNSVSEFELKKLQIKLELAKAKLDEIKE